tara:strand:- start:1119 stop:1547 length:429 start_codon:yes stop_codon:yes gene_type:complete
MKKLLLLSALLIFACSSEDNSDINNDDNSSIIGYWNFYSALGVTLCGSTNSDIVYYDSDCYCDNVFIEFNTNGTFSDYYDFISTGNPGCSNEILTGTWTNTSDQYQLNYDDGYIDTYEIIFIDENTITYEFDDTVYTYKKTL